MDPVTGAALISAGAEIFGSWYGANSSAKSARETNEMNREMAREQMAFQERMDSTKYQRGVADARAAGFNPLVAFPGSGGSPIGASAVMQNPKPNRGELFLATARALSEVVLNREMAKTEQTKQELNRAETDAKGGKMGIPGLFELPINRIVSFINSARNFGFSSARAGAETKKSNRNIDAKTVLNMLMSGPMGIGN